MSVNVRVRGRVMRCVSLLIAVLLLSQAVLVAGAQNESASQAAAGYRQGSPKAKVSGSLPSASGTAMAEDNLPSAPEPQSPSQSQQQPPQLPQQPVGTAAAPAEKPVGVPGSRPSGAAIAPAKQRRVRAFVISIGIALAAGAAVGTVVGLSKASHSAPQ